MNEGAQPIAAWLNELLRAAELPELDPVAAERFSEYCALLQRWNTRTNLTAIRDTQGILSRHFVESIACAHVLPAGIGTLLDFGSGAGFPGIPIALVRPEIHVTLAESQGKKAAFLREAVRVLELSSTVHSARAELLCARFGCVALRAVDRMSDAVPVARKLVEPGGWLAVMTTEAEMKYLHGSAMNGLVWSEPIPLFGNEQRVLALGQTERSLGA